MTHYQQTIAEILKAQGIVGVSPRHVEAWMRTENPTLDAMTPAAFRNATIEFAQMIAHWCSTELSERLAKSLGV